MSYLQYEQTGLSASGKTRIIAVRSRDGGPLGVIAWYAPWREYTFAPRADTVFDAACLQDIAVRCVAETEARKAERATSPEGPTETHAPVLDLMQALKESLAKHSPEGPSE